MTKKKHYPDITSNTNFPDLEKKILSYWKENNIFQRSIDNRASNKEFIFYDGPPFANGLPHYGHLLTGFIKDVYARYQTLKGKKVDRKFGWDCHGLPAEMQSEKELGFSGRLNITKFGIDKFNDHCRTSVMKYTKEWQQYVERQARFVDFENSYKTMDKNFMESVLWVFKELYKKGFIYEAMRVMPYSWACETPLSNFETRLDNSYRERADKAVTVSFILNEKPAKISEDFAEYRILAWTTTPWTLPSNLALAVGENIEYAIVSKENICYILGKFALKSYLKELNIESETDLEKLPTIKGSDLKNLSYKPLFDYFENHPNSFKILSGDFVTEGDGTGIVHIAPGFGEDDQIICNNNNIELVCPVDNSGKFTKEIYDFESMQVFEANDPIIIKLKNQGNWVKTEQCLHNYPHCWRTDTPLIYKAVPSYYVKVTAFKDRMVELNQKINWIPENVKDGLFGKWLENARDWSISRNRFWGTPIPIWKSDDPKYPRMDVYGSIDELEKDFAVKIEDLHRPFIDELTRPNPDDPTGKSMMKRVEDVFDCWFESGSMPYGQAHYPFENKDWFEKHFPADFIVEYSAQTRGWFYTLMVLSTAIMDAPPFFNCICHGVILDATGQKLSKRLNNYVDPIELFDKYGADALRVTMLSSTVVKGQELLIDKEGKMVFDSIRLFINPIWNSYRFFTLYANVDGIQAELYSDFKYSESHNSLDYYILAKLKIAIARIETGLDKFDSIEPYNAISEFFEILNNWYIRRSRNRFWKSEIDDDKKNAYNVLYTCLHQMSIAISPLLPLIAEEIYLGLTSKDKDSVHLQDFPKSINLTIDFKDEANSPLYEHMLLHVMDRAQDYCNSALSIRDNENIRIRQPLSKLTIIVDGEPIINKLCQEMKIDFTKMNKQIEHEMLDLIKSIEPMIKEEINAKEFEYKTNFENYVIKNLSINFPILGKRLPNKMKDIIAASKKNEWHINEQGLLIADEVLNKEEYSFALTLKENIKGAAVLTDNSGIAILDLNITNDLYEEGLARDLVRFVQEARKNAELNISDRIKLKFDSEFDLSKILKNYGIFIQDQTLSIITESVEALYSTEVILQGNKILIKIGLA